MVKIPTFKYERELLAQGFRAIVGVDEVGCGALAGPVMAGAIIFPLDSGLKLVRDSKTLSYSQREKLYGQICDRATQWAVGEASAEEITKYGLRPATFLAMRRAVEQISEADMVLVDAWEIPKLGLPQRGIIRGDQQVKSIAAASIVAKVTRDRLMERFAQDFPEYGFEKHMGYGTKVHRTAIEKHGPCSIHRLNYRIFSNFTR